MDDDFFSSSVSKRTRLGWTKYLIEQSKNLRSNAEQDMFKVIDVDSSFEETRVAKAGFRMMDDHYSSSLQEEMLNSVRHLLPNFNFISPEDNEAEEEPVVLVPECSAEQDEYTTLERHSNERRLGVNEDEADVEKVALDSDVFSGCESKLNVFDSDCADEANVLLQCNGKNAVEEVECVRCRVRAKATDCVCVSGDAWLSSKVCILPSSFDKQKMTDNRNGLGSSQEGRKVGNCRGSSSAGVVKQGIGDADSSSGKKSLGSNEEEPTEEEQTDNILKVLSLLVKQQRPVYKEKVEIVDSAIKAGISFPRPSWWAEEDSH